MFYSIEFTKVANGIQIVQNTWEDLHLIPSSRPEVTIPSRAFKMVEIPGRDGGLDLSDYLIGRPTYSMRNGSWEYIVVEDYEGRTVDERSWVERRLIMNGFFDGSEMKVRFVDYMPNYYYKGRVYVEGWRTGPSFSTVTIGYQLNPYKYDLSGTEAGL